MASEKFVKGIETTLEKTSNTFNKVKDNARTGLKKSRDTISTVSEKTKPVLKKAVEQTGKGIETAAEKTGEGIKTAAEKTSEGIKTAAEKTGEGIKTAAEKTGEGIKTAAEKTGKGIKKVTPHIPTALDSLKTVAHFIPTAAGTTAYIAGVMLASFVEGVVDGHQHAEILKQNVGTPKNESENETLK